MTFLFADDGILFCSMGSIPFPLIYLVMLL
uniref:Uncharacterized protein n=1 Tax=Rhizophora mucronata TaxID=61149 RepID=A0A2P2J9S7_RHIMU